MNTTRAWGADAVVYVRDSGFSPSSVSINVHETVYFIVADDNAPYCIQSTIGAWTPWYLWDYGDGVGITINEKGDYYYRDIFYGNTGVIHVGTVVHVPPTVTILAPTNGAAFTAPATFTLAASITDPDNGLWAVEFRVGDNVVDTLYTGPYSTQVTNLPAGDYTLTAIAYGFGSGSNSITIKVEAPPITIRPPRLVAGQLQLEVTGLAVGQQAVLQASSSLGPTANWASLQTVSITGSTLSFSLPTTPGARFFRVLQLP